MAGAERIRAAIDAMMQLPSTKGMALDVACELAELERHARFVEHLERHAIIGREHARLQCNRAGLEEGARREAVR